MSIKIETSKCVACGQCTKVCPGNLIYKDSENKAYIKHPERCWGCTACLKECNFGAIKYYLGEDIGGKGATMFTIKEEKILRWVIQTSDDAQEEKEIKINRKDANKY